MDSRYMRLCERLSRPNPKYPQFLVDSIASILDEVVAKKSLLKDSLRWVGI